MKKILVYAVLLSCSVLNIKAQDRSQAGVYKLEKQTFSGGGKDSVYKLTQTKFYTDRHFVYAGMAPDSSVGFGVGTYVITGNKIVERNIYNGRSLDSAGTYNLLITKKGNGYTQNIPEMAVINGVKYSLKEEYTKLPGTSSSSMLDGLWKQEKSFTVKGKDSTKQKVTQFKIFWQGHFMFVHRYPADEAGTKFKNAFGFGVFNLKNNTVNEEEQISNYSTILNQKFIVKVKFNGNDEYTQVITDPKTSDQLVETYRRVK